MSINIDKQKLRDALPLWTLATRTSQYTLSYYADGYYTTRVSSVAPTNIYGSLWTIGAVFDFGTYQCKAYIKNPGANRGIHVFGFEYHHGWAGEGLIWFQNVGGTYTVANKVNETTTQTDLPGEDWTTEKTFKIEWASASIKFYVDGALKATHTTNIPQNPMSLYIESYTGGTAPGVEFGIWSLKEFQEL
ncbi:MAG: family 16 glycosylhydrolase [Candidatus Bathyarchaeota archaeon]|nr:family 16 glycosylhydrolase [Candidatus Bathyarchaeota archaeon]